MKTIPSLPAPAHPASRNTPALATAARCVVPPLRPAILGVLTFAAFALASAPLHLLAATPAVIWSDEFNQPDNSTPDTAKWAYDLGGNGWGNNELETYTNSADNAFIASDPNASDGKALVIKAIKSSSGGYTSARLKTQGKFTARYGRIEARMKIAAGQGIWPAFWMLGANIDTINWPDCGEIDILESIGANPTTVYGTLHGPGYSGAAGRQGRTTLSSGTLDQAYHVYAVDWSPGKIVWSLDGTAYHTETPATIPAGTRWVFDDSPFLMILNLAVGGDWPGNPDSTTVFPQTLAVDYVRVYGLPPAAAPAQLAAYASGIGEVTLSWRPPNDTAVAENLTGYQLERATDPDFTQNVVVTPLGLATSYIDSAATPGASYYYRLSAVNAGGVSDPANSVLVHTPASVSTGSPAPLTNISARAYCGLGDNVTIGGFVIGPGAGKHILVRAVGPTLSTMDLASEDLLADPQLELHDADHDNAVIATNDNWIDNANAADIVTTGARIGATPFANNPAKLVDHRSAALLLTMLPGIYTFVVRGKNSSTGIVLLEIYDAD
jgi:beta-glucanase (GH16 family)